MHKNVKIKTGIILQSFSQKICLKGWVGNFGCHVRNMVCNMHCNVNDNILDVSCLRQLTHITGKNKNN